MGACVVVCVRVLCVHNICKLDISCKVWCACPFRWATTLYKSRLDFYCAPGARQTQYNSSSSGYCGIPGRSRDNSTLVRVCIAWVVKKGVFLLLLQLLQVWKLTDRNGWGYSGVVVQFFREDMKTAGDWAMPVEEFEGSEFHNLMTVQFTSRWHLRSCGLGTLDLRRLSMYPFHSYFQHHVKLVPLVLPRRSKWVYTIKEGVPREVITMLTQDYDLSKRGILAYMEKSRWMAVKADHK